MKQLSVVIILSICWLTTNAQSTEVDYKQRALRNLQYLVKDSSIHDFFVIDDRGITMFEDRTNKLEFRLNWSEVDKFLHIMHNYSYYDMLDFYKRKGSSAIHLSAEDRENFFIRHKPESFQGLRIAIDPGHSAGSWEEAVWEKKYIKLEGERLGLNHDIKFYEAQLTNATAYILKDKLEQLGAEVFISHEPGQSAVGISFDEWYENHYKNDVIALRESGDFSPSFASRLLRTQNKFDAYNYVYQYIDFVNRSRRINHFKPDITIVVHYNADEYSNRQENHYWEPTDRNFSMAFVPGAFMTGELQKLDQRLEFVRLLVSPDLEESIELAGVMLQRHVADLKVSPFPDSLASEMVRTSAIPTPHQGAFSRNLYLTRAIESPVVYMESLYQDNVQEAIKLNDQTYQYKEIKTSKRVEEVTDSYIKSLAEWMQCQDELKFIFQQ